MVVVNKLDVVLDGYVLEMKMNDGSFINIKYVVEKEWNLLWIIILVKMFWGVEDMFYDLIDVFYFCRV